MDKLPLIFYCKRPSKNRSFQNEIDVCVLWLKYLVGASELLVTVFSTDDGVTDFWFLYFRSFISEIRQNIPLQAASIVVSTAVIFGLILQQVCLKRCIEQIDFASCSTLQQTLEHVVVIE